MYSLSPSGSLARSGCPYADPHASAYSPSPCSPIIRPQQHNEANHDSRIERDKRLCLARTDGCRTADEVTLIHTSPTGPLWYRVEKIAECALPSTVTRSCRSSDAALPGGSAV